MNKIHALTLAIMALLASSCQSFLGNVPKGKQIPTDVADYELLLNNEKQVITFGIGVDLLADDVKVPARLDINYYQTALNNMTERWQNIYLYKDDVYGAENSDLDYDEAYKRIFTYNAIIEGIPDASGDETRKREVLAEAKLGRAYEYFYLVNIYGPAYQKAQASAIKTIPIILTARVAGIEPSRATQAEVYEQIITDIEEAIPGLPEKPKYNDFRASQKSGYALYAKVALQMHDYKKALQYADKALEANSRLIDLKTINLIESSGIGKRSDYPDLIDNPENLYTRLTSPPGGWSVYALVDDALRGLYDAKKDKRYALFIIEGDTTTEESMISGPQGELIWAPEVNFNVGLSTPEMYLIAAECEARIGSTDKALKWLNKLRENRILGAEPIVGSNRKSIIQEILNERRREFAFKTLFRVVDLKRLSQDPDFAVDVVHNTPNGGTIVAHPSDPDYLTMPLPKKATAFWK